MEGPGGEAPSFEAAPKPMQEDIEWVVRRAKRRIQRYLEKRGVITFAAAPGEKPCPRGSFPIPHRWTPNRCRGQDLATGTYPGMGCSGGPSAAKSSAETTIRTLLAAMHLPTGPPKVASMGPAAIEVEDLDWSGGGKDQDWLD